MPNKLFATKSIAELPGQESSENQLQRVLSAPALTLLGIGAIIGTGIFVLTGTAAAQHAGPALALSFIVAAIGCTLAICYIGIEQSAAFNSIAVTDLARPFRTPAPYLTCTLGAIICFVMMVCLGTATWARLIAWTAVGVIVYVSYGRKHSRVWAQLSGSQSRFKSGSAH